MHGPTHEIWTLDTGQSSQSLWVWVPMGHVAALHSYLLK